MGTAAFISSVSKVTVLNTFDAERRMLTVA
jgi:hypothetical protein